MQSFILIGNTEKIQTYLSSFYKKNAMDVFDQIILHEEGSIGIEAIRKIQESLYMSPYKSKHKTLVVENAERLTIESQNALLKLLEEPPSHIFIFLTASSENFFLPTVLSRCILINLSEEKEENTNQEDLEKYFQIITEGSVGEKLALAETIAKEKDTAGKLVKELILFMRKKMLNNPKSVLFPLLLEQLQKVFTLMQTTNVSQRVLLEHAFLSQL